jgi:Domain of unknown function (DUF4249)
MKFIKVILILIIPLLFIRCGDPGVDISNVSYEPKIAVEGYLYAGETIHDIKLTRNFALGQSRDFNKLALTPQDNSVNVSINGIPLLYDPQSKTYYNNSVIVEFGKTYKLSVSAVFDGKQLRTESVTTVPQKGFKLINAGNLGNIRYGIDNIKLDFRPSPGCDLYVFAVIADSASTGNFIYNNTFNSIIDSSDVRKDLNNYKTQFDAVSDIDSYADALHSFNVKPYMTWFYSSYKTFVYAGDKNFRNYLFSVPNVKEFDGNFHEPVQIFTGDGIGVFASAVRDTVVFNIVK